MGTDANDDATNWLPGGLTPAELERERAKLAEQTARDELEMAQMEASGGIGKFDGEGYASGFGAYAHTDPEAHCGKTQAAQLKKSGAKGKRESSDCERCKAQALAFQT